MAVERRAVIRRFDTEGEGFAIGYDILGIPNSRQVAHLSRRAVIGCMLRTHQMPALGVEIIEVRGETSEVQLYDTENNKLLNYEGQKKECQK